MHKFLPLRMPHSVRVYTCALVTIMRPRQFRNENNYEHPLAKKWCRIAKGFNNIKDLKSHVEYECQYARM